MLRLLGMLLLGVGLVVPAAQAQRVSFDARRSIQALSAGYYQIDFEFDGDEDPVFGFDFTGPAFGLVYSRPHVLVTFGLGDQEAGGGNEGLRLLDVSFTTWGELYPQTLGSNATRLFFPLVLFSNYRRVAPEGEEAALIDAFNVTVLGLGLGLGFDRLLGEHGLFEVRAHPVVGLASSSFTNALGSARLLDADVQLHLGRLYRRVGLTAGYTFRAQVWDVNASDIFPELTEDLFDYKGTQHLVRLGLNW